MNKKNMCVNKQNKKKWKGKSFVYDFELYIINYLKKKKEKLKQKLFKTCC